MDFDELLKRLLTALRHRVQNGELTERGLARMTGISQPHIHNVLKGKRILSIRSADRIIRKTRFRVVDLIDHGELAASFCVSCRGLAPTRCKSAETSANSSVEGCILG